MITVQPRVVFALPVDASIYYISIDADNLKPLCQWLIDVSLEDNENPHTMIYIMMENIGAARCAFTDWPAERPVMQTRIAYLKDDVPTVYIHTMDAEPGRKMWRTIAEYMNGDPVFPHILVTFNDEQVKIERCSDAAYDKGHDGQTIRTQ